MEPLYCFIDDIQFPELSVSGGLPADRVFGYAAYVISASGLEAVVNGVLSAKAEVGLRPSDPIKCSMDQQIERVYRQVYGPQDSGEHFRKARGAALDIGHRALVDLVAHGARVFACLTWPYSPTPEQSELLRWSFEDLLQRVGLFVKDRGEPSFASVIVVMDRPDDPLLYNSFFEAAYRGQTTGGTQNFCGPLTSLGVLDTLMFSSTPHSIPLQVADFVARACRDFVHWWDTGRKVPTLFVPLIPALHRNYSGQVDRIGFVIEPRPGVPVDTKLGELLKLAQASGADGS